MPSVSAADEILSLLDVRLSRWVILTERVHLVDVVANYLLVAHGVRPSFLQEGLRPRALRERVDNAMHRGGLTAVYTDMGAFYCLPDKEDFVAECAEANLHGNNDAFAQALGYPVRGGLPRRAEVPRWGFTWDVLHLATGHQAHLTSCVTDDLPRDQTNAQSWTRAMQAALKPAGIKVFFSMSEMDPLSTHTADRLVELWGPPPRHR